jgi:hypothetical protein
MGDDPKVRVDELVSLARRAEPQALDALALKFPQDQLLFRPGGALGAGAGADPGVEVALLALDAYTPQAKRVLDKIRRTLERLRRLDLAAKLLSVAGAAGTIAFLTGKRVPEALIASILSLASGVASVLVAWGGTALGGGPGSLAQDFNDLVDKLARAASLRREIEALKGDPKAKAALADKLAEAERLADALNRYALKYGVD